MKNSPISTNWQTLPADSHKEMTRAESAAGVRAPSSLLVLILGGWSARAHDFPTFSRGWFHYRALSYLVPSLIYSVCILASYVIAIVGQQIPFTWRLFAGALCIWLTPIVLFYLGRWLATQVYEHRWKYEKEVAGIAISLLFGLMLSMVLASVTDGSSTHGVRVEIPNSLLVRIFPGINEHPLAANIFLQGLAIKNPSHQFLMSMVRYAGLLVILYLPFWLGGGFDFAEYIRQAKALRAALLKQELERTRRMRNEIEQRLSILAAQIDPQFLLHSLKSVRSSAENDPLRGVDIIDHLVGYLRATIPQVRDDGGNSLATVGPQLDAARAYLGVMHARFPQLKYTVECDSSICDMAVPPLVLMPLLEGAVKQSMESAGIDPVHIELRAIEVTTSDGARILITIGHDRISPDTQSFNWFGIDHVRESLAQIYGEQAQLTIDDQVGRGVAVSVSLPVAS